MNFENFNIRAKHEVTSLGSVSRAMPSFSLCSTDVLLFLTVHHSAHSVVLIQLSTLGETDSTTSLAELGGGLGFSAVSQRAPMPGHGYRKTQSLGGCGMVGTCFEKKDPAIISSQKENKF